MTKKIVVNPFAALHAGYFWQRKYWLFSVVVYFFGRAAKGLIKASAAVTVYRGHCRTLCLPARDSSSCA